MQNNVLRGVKRQSETRREKCTLKEEYISIAKVCKKIQCEGVMDAYMEAAKDICYKNNVVVCNNDC